MTTNFTETIRTNTLSFMLPYDENLQDFCSYLSIGHINGRYGILKEDGTTFLPFEYDNITPCGFGLLQLIQNGKLGLLHVDQLHINCDFPIMKQIACEYDIIEVKYEDIVFLRKFSKSTEFFCGSAVQIYLTKPSILTSEYQDASILSTAYGGGLVNLIDTDSDIVISTETGEILAETPSAFTLGSFDTGNAAVLQQFIGSHSRLLRIEKKGIKEYIFDGAGASAITGLSSNGTAPALWFIAEANNGYILLDNELNPIADEHFKNVSVQSTVYAVSSTGKKFTFPMKELKLEFLDDEEVFL